MIVSADCNRSRVRDNTLRTCGTSTAAAPFLLADVVIVDGPKDDKSGSSGRSSPHGTREAVDNDETRLAILFAIVECGRTMLGALFNLASRNTDSS